MSDAIKTTFGFMNLQTGRFLRVCKHDEPFDGQEAHADAWFSKDSWHPIWETEDAAVIIDILHPWGSAPFLSEDARWGGIPAFGLGFGREELNAMIPVAFQRSMAAIIDGGDLLPVAMTVSGVHFEIARDPNSVWLVSLETSEAVKLTA